MFPQSESQRSMEQPTTNAGGEGESPHIPLVGVQTSAAIMEISVANSQKAKNKNGNRTQLYSSLAQAQRTEHHIPQVYAQSCSLLIYSQ